MQDLHETMTDASDKVGSVAFFFAVIGTLAGCGISFWTIFEHLKNYRRPSVQRLTIRILLMVPIYAIASLTSLSSKTASEYIDLIRDIYEAFVIYSFFLLCIDYLGGERALLAMLDERMRTHHLWPFNYCFAPMDMSDPDTFLFVRRGVLQFVVLKPVLSIFTMILKLTDNYHEGHISWTSTYMWLSLLYNCSVCWSLYCLVLFYVQCSRDLKPYRPVPKFICVKAIVFLTWYQGLGIAFLTRIGAIQEKDDYSAADQALAVQDFLICLEMPFLAMLHWYAFPWTDYDDKRLSSRLLFPAAARDALGIQDIIQDSYHTFHGTTFRSSRGGWPAGVSQFHVETTRPLNRYGIFNSYGSVQRHEESHDIWADESTDFDSSPFENQDAQSVISIEFRIDPDSEAAYDDARRLPFGDYNYPVVHEDPRYRDPPVVRAEIERRTEAYLRADREQGGRVLAKDEDVAVDMSEEETHKEDSELGSDGEDIVEDEEDPLIQVGAHLQSLPKARTSPPARHISRKR